MKYKINQEVYMLDEFGGLFVKKGVVLGYYDISSNKKMYYVQFGDIHSVKYEVEEYLLFESKKECLQHEYTKLSTQLKQIKKEMNKEKDETH